MTFLKLYPQTFDRDNTVNAHALVNETIGPLFVGYTVSAALFGITCAQSCLYFQRHSQDSMRLKCIVTGLLFLEALHIILVTHSVFVYTIAGHGNFNRLGDVVW